MRDKCTGTFCVHADISSRETTVVPRSGNKDSSDGMVPVNELLFMDNRSAFRKQRAHWLVTSNHFHFPAHELCPEHLVTPIARPTTRLFQQSVIHVVRLIARSANLPFVSFTIRSLQFLMSYTLLSSHCIRIITTNLVTHINLMSVSSNDS